MQNSCVSVTLNSSITIHLPKAHEITVTMNNFVSSVLSSSKYIRLSRVLGGYDRVR